MLAGGIIFFIFSKNNTGYIRGISRGVLFILAGIILYTKNLLAENVLVDFINYELENNKIAITCEYNKHPSRIYNIKNVNLKMLVKFRYLKTIETEDGICHLKKIQKKEVVLF